MGRQTHTVETTTLLLALAGTLLSSSVTRAGEQNPGPGLTRIQISFKLDPRLIDSTYGAERWVSPPTYRGANAQDTVEARAQGIDGKGRLTHVSPEWIPSDPEMVTVSPSQGDHVKISVHRAGESKLTIAAPGFSKEFRVKATYLGNAIQVEIAGENVPPAVAATREPPALKSQKEKVSYAVGMQLANSLQKQSLEVDADLLMQGVQDTLSGRKTLMTESEARSLLIGVQTEPRNGQLAEKNKKDGEAFLAANKAKEGIVTLESGLQYRILKAGDGEKPTLDSTVVCSYRGTLIDGTEFDSSYRSKKPASLPLKALIKGWSEALQLMPVGSQWQLFIPGDLGYGQRGVPRRHIGPNTTLIFEVELLAVQGPAGGSEQATDATASPATAKN